MTRSLTIAFVAAITLSAGPASAQMGPNLDLTWSTIDAGGGTSSGAGFTLTGTIGQPDAGTMSGVGFELSGGFWAGAGGPPPCYPDCNGSTTLTVADFGCFQTKFVAQDPYADCNQSGTLTVADFGCFQTSFVAGCP
jgi:hypothetical protein